MRYKVVQSRNGDQPVQVGPVTRRFNGAVSIRDEHVALAKEHLQSKAQPGDRVIEGPAAEDETVVFLVGPNVSYSISTRIERVLPPNHLERQLRASLDLLG